MRIGLVVPGGVDPPGGERVIPFVHHLVESLSAEHDVTVVAVGHDREAAEWTLFGAHVVNVPLGTHSKADIARVLVQVPKAIGRHGRPDIVHGLWANLPGLAAVAAARRYSVPSVVSVCGGELAAVPEIGYGGGLRRGTRLLAITALRAATEVTVATQWMHSHVAQALPARRSIEVVPLGADLRHLDGGAGTATDQNRLVHLAGLNRVKDQDLLLRAFAILAAERPALTLTIAGGDTLNGHHRRLAEELGVADRVTLLGHVPHEQLGEVLHGAALHLLTSHHDAGPVAVLEAAACGVPTVGTHVGHVQDLAGITAALVVLDRTAEDFAAAVAEVLDDRPWRDEMAANAQRWALRHDAVFTASTFEALYRRLSARLISA